MTVKVVRRTNQNQFTKLCAAWEQRAESLKVRSIRVVVTTRNVCFQSKTWGEGGISVHVVHGVWRAVKCASTTNLPDRRRADNLLKHDT